ncbi:MAG: hypothetical protein R3B09_14595 [Nannocystaceae bacterium]
MIPRLWISTTLLVAACFVDEGGATSAPASTAGTDEGGTTAGSSAGSTSKGSTSSGPETASGTASTTSPSTTTSTASTSSATTSSTTSSTTADKTSTSDPGTSTSSTEGSSTTGDPTECVDPETLLEWTLCCAEWVPASSLYFNLLGECLCGAMEKCSEPCSGNLCARQPIDEACLNCVFAMEDECSDDAFSTCFMDPECGDFLDCAFD